MSDSIKKTKKTFTDQRWSKSGGDVLFAGYTELTFHTIFVSQ